MYRGRVQRDLDQWVLKGLVQRGQADAMLAELDSRPASFSLGGVLMILAAVLLSASLLLMIAAGWEAIPRLVKIVGAFVLIWLFHLAAAMCLSRAANRLAAALLVLGSASFGGAIALVGQQYHLSGDSVDAMLVWFSMTVVSALLFRSSALTYASGVLAFALFATVLEDHGGDWDSYHAATVIAAGLAVAGLSAWTGALRAAHFSYLLGLGVLFWIYVHESSPVLAAALALVGVLSLLAVTARGLPWSGTMSRLGAAPGFYALCLALMGLALLHPDLDGAAAMALVSFLTVAVCIAALVLAGRDNGALRVLAYVAFAVEVLYLSFVTIDTMLGTSGFFLMSGFVVALLAYVVIRVERHFGRKAGGAAP